MNSKKILAFSLGPIGSAVLGLVTLPIIAWYFTPEDIGRLTMLQVTISFGLLLFTLGLDQAYVREFHGVDDQPALLKAVVSPGLIVLILVLVMAFVQPWSLSEFVFGIDSAWLTVLLVIAVLVSFFSRFLSLVLRMQERGLAFSLSQLLPKLVFLIIIGIYVWFGVNASFDHLILANTISLMSVLLIFTWNTRTQWLPAISAQIDYAHLKMMRRFAYPLIVSGAAFWGLTTIDKIFLRSFSSFEELGIYSMAVNFAAVGLVFQAIFSTVWAPIVYKWVAEGVDPQKIKNVMDYVTLAVVVVWSLAGMFSWAATYILPPEYSRVQYILLAAMAYPLLYTLSEATGVGIGIKCKTMFYLLAAIVALMSNAIGNWLLIPIYGSAGAAMASAVAFLVFFAIRTEASAWLWMGFSRWRMYGLMIGLVALSFTSNAVQISAFLLVAVYLIVAILGLLMFKQQTKTSLDYVLTKLKREFNH